MDNPNRIAYHTVAKNDENIEKKLLRQEIEKNAHVKDPYEKALIAIE